MRRVTLRGIGPPSRSQDPNLLTPESTEAIDTTAGENITSEDPNEKVGLAGYGEQHLARVDDEFQYVVYFENMPEAGAPAQEVFVTDYLDPDLDWSTFRLTEIAWGDYIISVPENTADFYTRQTVEDYRAEVEKSWWVDVQVALNYETGRVRWIFHTLDPDTGELPMDVFAKMLGHAFESRLDRIMTCYLLLRRVWPKTSCTTHGVSLTAPNGTFVKQACYEDGTRDATRPSDQ